MRLNISAIDNIDSTGSISQMRRQEQSDQIKEEIQMKSGIGEGIDDRTAIIRIFSMTLSGQEDVHGT